MILPAQIGPAPRTGAQLRRRDGIRPVVGIQPDDTPVMDVRDQQAAPTAVMGRAAGSDDGRLTVNGGLFYGLFTQ
jgi:hypothetical protein